MHLKKNPDKILTAKSLSTKRILHDSITIAQTAGIKKTNIIIDPSIGFFRKEGNNPFFTKITKIPWYCRDIEIVYNLKELSKANFSHLYFSFKQILSRKTYESQDKRKTYPIFNNGGYCCY